MPGGFGLILPQYGYIINPFHEKYLMGDMSNYIREPYSPGNVFSPVSIHGRKISVTRPRVVWWAAYVNHHL